VTGFSRGPRRTDHAYDKTDVILLGGGAVLVLLGLGLAADSWFAPKGQEGEKPAFVASADSARTRFLTRTPSDSAASSDTTGAGIPAAGLRDAVVPDSAASKAASDSSVRARAATAPTPAAKPAPAPKPSPSTPLGSATPAAAASAPKTATTPVPAPTSVATPVPPADPTANPATAATDWGVQAGAFGARENADRLAAKLKELGYTAIVIQTGSLHRVRAIGFPTRDAAATAQLTIAEAAGATAVLLPPGS